MTTEQPHQQIRTDGRHSFPGKSSGELAAPRDRAERFVDMICLLADGGEWPAKRLSAELKVTVRTIHRDMQLLEAKGLATRKCGRHGSYRLAQDTAWERPRLVTKEVIALWILAARDEASAHGGGLALEAVLKIIRNQPENVRRPLLELTDLILSQPAAARTWLCRQAWLATLLEGVVATRPLKVWLEAKPGQRPEPPLEIVPSGLTVHSGHWMLQSHHVSPTGGIVTFELAQLTSAEFER
jgi:predicted DNA-binding transcriptional regulator YafY